MQPYATTAVAMTAVATVSNKPTEVLHMVVPLRMLTSWVVRDP